MLIQQLVNALTLGAIYSLIALGYTLVYGILAMINFAHSEVLMLGSFCALGFAMAVPAAFAGGAAGLAGMFAAAMLGAGLLNVIIERLAYRPLRDISRLAPLISAIGVPTGQVAPSATKIRTVPPTGESTSFSTLSVPRT